MKDDLYACVNHCREYWVRGPMTTTDASITQRDGSLKGRCLYCGGLVRLLSKREVLALREARARIYED